MRGGYRSRSSRRRPWARRTWRGFGPLWRTSSMPRRIVFVTMYCVGLAFHASSPAARGRLPGGRAISRSCRVVHRGGGPVLLPCRVPDRVEEMPGAPGDAKVGASRKPLETQEICPGRVGSRRDCAARRRRSAIRMAKSLDLPTLFRPTVRDTPSPLRGLRLRATRESLNDLLSETHLPRSGD